MEQLHGHARGIQEHAGRGAHRLNQAERVQEPGRRFPSTLEAALFADNVPVQVFHNAIDVFRSRIPLWQRYFELRRRALRLGTLRHSDMWAPLAKTREVVSYEQAVRIICKGLAPLGEEYVATVRSRAAEGSLGGRASQQGQAGGRLLLGSIRHPSLHPHELHR